LYIKLYRLAVKAPSNVKIRVKIQLLLACLEGSTESHPLFSLS